MAGNAFAKKFEVGTKIITTDLRVSRLPQDDKNIEAAYLDINLTQVELTKFKQVKNRPKNGLF